MISILYIDDWPPLLNLVRRFLEKNGDMLVETSYSTEEGLEKIDSILFDVIVTDYNLKESVGFDFLREARLRGFRTPFIFFTSWKNNGIEEEVSKYGPVVFVPKILTSSSSFNLLENTIRTIVPTSHSRNMHQPKDPAYSSCRGNP